MMLVFKIIGHLYHVTILNKTEKEIKNSQESLSIKVLYIFQYTVLYKCQSSLVYLLESAKIYNHNTSST